jgi:hypothetical protein
MPSPFLGKAFSWACKRLTQNMVKNNANMILSLNFIGDMLLMRTKITLFRDYAKYTVIIRRSSMS